MNPNPYPQGRWTQCVATAARRKPRHRLPSEPVASLIGAPLRELFWGIPESRLLEEAKLRIEHVVASAKPEPIPLSADAQPELAVA